MINSTVTGNLGKNAERREVNGDTVVSFTMASKRYDSKTKSEVVDWVSVNYWGKRAVAAFPYLNKGKVVAVHGNIWVREYAHNGTVKFSLECRADDVELLGGGNAERPTEVVAPTEDIPF